MPYLKNIMEKEEMLKLNYNLIIYFNHYITFSQSRPDWIVMIHFSRNQLIATTLTPESLLNGLTTREKKQRPG